MGRRITVVDAMLFATVLLWALNFTATRFAVTHGFRPLAYATERYGAAIAIFAVYTWVREGTFRIERRDLKLVLVGGISIFLNQVAFVFAVKRTSASTVGLIIGTTPIWVGLMAAAVGLERPRWRFWIAACVTFAGIALIAVGSSGGLSGDLLGYGLAVVTAITWSSYTIVVGPLMRRYSPFRISSAILAVGWVPLAAVSLPELSHQHYGGLPTETWAWLGFAVTGPLFLTNLLWYSAVARVGPSRAALFSNIQPFFAVLFAILFLSEHLTRWEVAGGIAIALAIVLERVRHPPPEAVARVPTAAAE